MFLGNKNKAQPNMQRILKKLFLMYPDPMVKMLLIGLKDPLEAKDEKDLQEVLKQNLEFLDKRLKSFHEKNDMQESAVSQFVENADNFPEEEWEELEELKLMMVDYELSLIQNSLSGQFGIKTNTKKKNNMALKRVRKNNWVPCK